MFLPSATQGEPPIVIPVAELIPGAVSANAFTGWINPAAQVTSRTIAGSTDNYFEFPVQSDPRTFMAKTTAASRDQEFVGWGPKIRVFIRLTDSGKAFCFTHMISDPSVTIHYCPTVVESAADDIVGTAGGYSNALGWYPLYSKSGLSEMQAALPGYSTSATSGHYFTFGTEGVDLYAKFNGVEFFRTKNVFILEPGRVALTARFDGGYGEGGYRQAIVQRRPGTKIYSDVDSRVLDVRDFGAKIISQTGSMTAGSNIVTVTDGSAWTVGDPIVVSTGGEADFGTGSGGARGGTRGVGGQWPTLLYATVAAMNADMTQTNGRICGITGTGRTYRWDGSSWSLYTTFNNYVSYILPRAIIGTVVAVNGNQLTLDKTAVISTTNAPVYYNCYTPLKNSLFNSGTNALKATNCTINWPAGRWAWGNPDNDQNIRMYGSSGWTLQGAGPTADGTVLFSPRGTLNLDFKWCATNGFVQDMRFEGSGLLTESLIAFYDNLDQFQGWTIPLHIRLSTDVVAQRVHGINGWQGIINISGSTNCILRNFYVYHATGTDRYTQWMVQIADGVNCIIEDGEIDFPQMMTGLETFRSTGSIIRRITGRNFTWSTNGSGNFRFEEITTRFEALCEKIGFPVLDQPIIDVNTNIPVIPGQPADANAGGLFLNCDIIIEGPMRADGAVWPIYNLSGDTDNIVIKGKYPTKPVSSPSGLIQYPARTDGNPRQFAVRVDTDARIVTVDGVRIVTDQTWTAIGGFSGTVKANTTVKNCVVDHLATGGTQTNNITNAAYMAL